MIRENFNTSLQVMLEYSARAKNRKPNKAHQGISHYEERRNLWGKQFTQIGSGNKDPVTCVPSLATQEPHLCRLPSTTLRTFPSLRLRPQLRVFSLKNHRLIHLNLHHVEKKRKSQGNPGFNPLIYNNVFPLTTAQKQRQEQRLKDKIDKAKLEEHVNNLVAEESRKRPEVSNHKRHSLYFRCLRLILG
jgi:hypothetical protein